MSYDLAVWHSDTAMSDDDAGDFYGHICEEWIIVREHPALRAFCRALMAEFPGVLDPAVLTQDFLAPRMSMTLTYADLIAGSKAPRAFTPTGEPQPPDWRILPTFNGLAMTMSLGSRKSEISPGIKRAANAVGLIAYNPQIGRCSLPPHLASQPTQPLPEPIRLLVEEQPDALAVKISFDGIVRFKGMLKSRREAHDQARQETIALNQLAYAVEDRRNISSAFTRRLERPAPTAGSDYIFNLLQNMPRSPNVPLEDWEKW